MKKIYLISLIFLFFPFVSQAADSPYVGFYEAEYEYNSLLTASCKSILTSKKYLQSSQSFGSNLMSGVMSLGIGFNGINTVNFKYPKTGQHIPSNFYDTNKVAYYYFDNTLAPNRQPVIHEFDAIIRGIDYTSTSGNVYPDYSFMKNSVNAAMLEAWGSDTASTATDNYLTMYNLYTSTYQKLQQDFPNINFVYYTRHVDGISAQLFNRGADKYSELLLNSHKGEVPIFDFGDILSTHSNGSSCMFVGSDGKTYRYLCDEYYVNSHPSTAEIETRLGKGWAVLMAKLYCPPVTLARTKPEFAKFNGLTTQFYSMANVGAVQNAVLEKNSKGKISFGQQVVDFSGADLDSNVTIENNLIGVDTAKLPNLNVPASITFYGLSFINPKVLKNGTTCTTCTITENVPGTRITVSVNGFSNYSITESGAQTCPLQGDVTCDQTVNSTDIQTAINIFLGINTNADQIIRADLNGDSKVNVSDIQKIINIVLGL